MLENYTIQRLGNKKLTEALALVKTVFMQFEAPDFSDEGIEEFLQCIEIDRVRRQLNSSALVMWVCQHNQKIVGVISFTPQGHIGLLFVAAEHHRQGIARELLQRGLRSFWKQGFTRITVNSSPYAVPVYKRLGFIASHAEQCVRGIRYTPMTLYLTKDHD